MFGSSFVGNIFDRAQSMMSDKRGLSRPALAFWEIPKHPS